VRKYSVKPVLTMRGRKFKGLRGLSGKPTHPPLTDIPIAAYVLAAVFDVISIIGGDEHDWSQDLWHAGAWLFAAGVIVSIPTALTGAVDWWTSSEPGTQARRTINTHATIMILVTLAALADTIWRWTAYDDHGSTPGGIVPLSVVNALVVSVGATFGGSLVFDYGFNVETAGDHPVWHKSEDDVFPGQH
jgi:uncharacterized membrane protein